MCRRNLIFRMRITESEKDGIVFLSQYEGLNQSELIRNLIKQRLDELKIDVLSIKDMVDSMEARKLIKCSK